MKVRELQQPRGWAFTLAVASREAAAARDHQRTWLDGENIPRDRRLHRGLQPHLPPRPADLSAHLLYDHGRLPRYLAKSGLFENKALACFLRSAGQIPVERLSNNAKGAYDAAVAAVRARRVRRRLPRGHADAGTRTCGR